MIMVGKGMKPTEIWLQAQKRAQKKSARILLMGKISHDAMRHFINRVSSMNRDDIKSFVSFQMRPIRYGDECSLHELPIVSPAAYKR